MAKSIYEVLDSLVTETSVPATGKMIEHTIPRELLPTAAEFENADMLKAWAEKKGVIHACLQKGVQKFLIDLRAAFKACKKDELWTVEMGQNAVDTAVWNITERPKVGNEKAAKDKVIFDTNLKLAKAMQENGLELDTIYDILTNSCGEDLADKIIDLLDADKDIDDLDDNDDLETDDTEE